jgi:hypothetical protein
MKPQVTHAATHWLARLSAVALCGAALGLSVPAAADDDAQMRAMQKQLALIEAQLERLSEENKALREHQAQLDRQLAQLAGGAPPPPAVAAVPATPATASVNASALPAAAPNNASALPASGVTNASALPATAGASVAANQGVSVLGTGLRLWGYGELYYTDTTRDRRESQADLARAVFGIGYSFDPLTEFNSEYEVEHAVSSASDVGEFEVEQFYVDRHLNDALSVRAGLFLMPFGLLNENHEPTNFYGMQRNFVETLIIPSTWREGGLNLHGNTAAGFGWNAGVTTGFDLSKWNFTPEFPMYTNALNLEDNDVAPLQATHQELGLASARNLAQYVALSYFGVPGLTVGGAIFSGDAVKVPAPPNAPIPGEQRVTLWEGHVRWMPGKWDLSALYAHGSISNLALANAANPGSPNPIPSSFYGYFFQGAYEVWNHGDYRLDPFVRFERYNLGASFAGTPGPTIPSGLVPLSATPGDYGLWPLDHDRVWTSGANFYLGPHVVLKLDYQWFEVNQNFNRLDLGLGVAF